jgi:urea transport system ATP-binding protein
MLLAIRGLEFSYGAVQALRGVNMDVPAGSVTCLMGRNGVGKTTLVGNIMGLLKSTAGEICYDGQNVTNWPAFRRARNGIGLVPQGRRIFPKLTVSENLAIGLEAAGGRTKAIPDSVYDMFPILKTMSRRLGGDLSGGQQQQLAIARALVGRPKILLLDEPTEGIQPNIIKQIGQVLRTLVQEQGMTVLLVEQYVDFVREFGDRFFIMDRGRIVAHGPSDQLHAGVVKEHLSV